MCEKKREKSTAEKESFSQKVIERGKGKRERGERGGIYRERGGITGARNHRFRSKLLGEIIRNQGDREIGRPGNRSSSVPDRREQSGL